MVDSLKASLNNWRDLFFLTIMLALSFLTIRTADFVAQIFVGGIPGLTPRNTLLAIPLAAAPMMVSLVLGPTLAILFTLIQASLTALFLDVGPGLSLYFAIAGLWAAQSQRTCHNRWDLIRLGFYSGASEHGQYLDPADDAGQAVLLGNHRSSALGVFGRGFGRYRRDRIQPPGGKNIRLYDRYAPAGDGPTWTSPCYGN